MLFSSLLFVHIPIYGIFANKQNLFCDISPIIGT